MKKLWHDRAWEEYSSWQSRDKKTLKRINSLLQSIDRNGYNYLRALNNMEAYGYSVSPIIEPTMLPSNVEGGLGLVSVGCDSKIVLRLKPMRIEGGSYWF